VGPHVKTFGSRVTRNPTIGNTSDLSIPGPGEYNPDESIRVLDDKRSKIQVNSSVFLRNYESVPKTVEAPAVGSYDPIRYTDLGIKSKLANYHSIPKREMREKLAKS
jgi:hypothetical protein